jgi:anaerobic selenocysteine-containing dehydrogenase
VENAKHMSKEQQVFKTCCAMCIDECGLNVYVENGKVTKVKGMPEHPWNRGAVCVKGQQIPAHVYHEERLKYPMKKETGNWKRISWDEALDTIASKLKEGREKYGPTSLDVLTGDPVAVAETTGWNLVWRFADLYGTPNRHVVDDLCGAAEFHGELVTYGKRCQCDSQLEEASNCIMVIGHNPHKSSPWQAARIVNAKKRGAKLIVVDPRRTPLAKKADIHAQLRPGTDGALLLAMLHTIITEDIYDKTFVEKWTIGFDKLAEHVKQFPPEWAEPITGVPAEMIRNMARMYATTKPAATRWGLMLAKQQCGFQNFRTLSIIWALTGNIDVKGENVRRSTGVHLHYHRLLEKMGDMKGVNADKYPLYDQIGPVKMALGTCVNWGDMILEGKPYLVKNMIISAANPLVTWPNTKKLDRALDELEFLVVMDLFMTETAKKADIVLPACTFLERPHISFVLSYTMLCRPVIEPVGECWSDCRFWLELAKRMGYEEYFPWKDDEEVLDYFLEPSGLTVKYLRDEHPTGLLPTKDHYGEYEKFGSFRTPSGKVELYSEQIEKMGISPLPIYREPPVSRISTPEIAKEYPLSLISGVRETEFWHSQHHNIPKLIERCPEPRAEIHPDTAGKYGIGNGEPMTVETKTGSMDLKADVTEDIMPDVVSITHGWSGQNALIDDTPIDPDSGYAPYTGILCKVSRKA